MLSRWLFGKVCMRWSQYQGRAAVQTPATDLMDEVSHTHLQREHNHLHQTHMGQHNEPHSYNVFLVTSFCLSAVFYYSTLTSAFNTCSCLFIRSTLNRPLESSTCFSKMQYFNCCQSHCIVSPSRTPWNILSWKCFLFFFIKATVQHLPLIGAILGVLTMCLVPSQIVLISKILRSWDWMLWQSWADKMPACLV